MNGAFESTAIKLDFNSDSVVVSFVSTALNLTFESNDVSSN